jgi:hypothetical protein
MDAGESCINEGISMMKMAYSILKEEMKENKCGWFELNLQALTGVAPIISYTTI